jgi:ribosomal protein S18 acetylase RimI-like enzyme
MEDAELSAMVDANLVAFVRHLTRLMPDGGLEERRDVLLGAGDDPTRDIVNSAIAIGSGTDAASILPAAAAFFGRRGHVYHVWTRGHADAALEAILPTAGFTLDVDLPVMVLEERPARVPTPRGVTLRQVADGAGVEDFRIADRASFADGDRERAAVDSAFRDPASLLDPAVAAFVAYVDGVPAAAAMSFTAVRVARIGWVGTVPAFRRRGLGAAVTRAAALVGFDRGARIAALESTPMGVPLYRSLGFRTITTYRIWSIA